MRELEKGQWQVVSGGYVNPCVINSWDWKMLHEDARHEALMDAVVGGALSVAAAITVLGLAGISMTTAPVVLGTVALAAGAASVSYNYGYWNYELWPWNY